MKREVEVYNYVKENSKYFTTIVNALNDGVREENLRLRREKSSVEAGLVLLCDRVTKKQLDNQHIPVLIEALNNCTFMKVDHLKDKYNKEASK